MTEETNAIGLNPLLAGLRSKAAEVTAKSSTTKLTNGKVGQDEFLKMLVTQLKNQDPLDPMKNDQFAVDLAQFSQLERLISIDEKLGQTSQQDPTSFAAYLGNDVVLNSDKIQVKNNEGGAAFFQLTGPSVSTRIEILDSSGQVVKTVDAGARGAGRHQVALSDLDLQNGEYTIRVKAQNASGSELTIPTNAAGTVTGFIPGADPTLLIGDREVKVADIKLVSAPR